MNNDSYIGNVIRAHGVENFVTAILKVCYSKEELDYWERRLIKSRDTKIPNGYNLTDGGEGIVGLKRTPEHCAKISAAKRNTSPFKRLIYELDVRCISYCLLAKLMGLSRQSVCAKMCTKQKFTDKDKNRLAEIFDKSAEYFLQRFE